MEYQRTESTCCAQFTCEKNIEAVTFFKIYNAHQKHEATFNRNVLLGVVGTDKVVAIFFYLQSRSADLLRCCCTLSPGIACAVLRAKFEKGNGTSLNHP